MKPPIPSDRHEEDAEGRPLLNVGQKLLVCGANEGTKETKQPKKTLVKRAQARTSTRAAKSQQCSKIRPAPKQSPCWTNTMTAGIN